MAMLAWRLLGRELRSGELRLLALALVVAVAAVTAVGFFTDRVGRALEREARQLLGADLLLVADHPWSRQMVDELARRPLQLAETRVFPSMVQARGQAQLADVKAVSDAYPLRGTLRLAAGEGGGDVAVAGGPRRGTVWVDERLATALGLREGDTVQVGALALQVAGVLTQEPDRGVNFFSVAPRLMFNLQDLAGTGLVQVGSRLTYRLLVAGDPDAVADFQHWAQARLQRGERIEDVRHARPELRTALDRAQRFLGLSTVLSVILAAVAVALSARRYLQRHLDACAIMRCLGATQGRLVAIHAQMFAALAVVAAVAGCAIGYGAHFALHFWLAELVAASLPAPSAIPALQGFLVAAILLLGFALPPVFQLRRVPTLRVLRRELGPPRLSLIGGYGLGLGLLVALMFWMAGDVRLGAWVALGFAVALVLFALLARALVRLLGLVRGGGSFGWRQGVANLERQGWASTVQIVALAVGLMAMFLLTVTRTELLAAWQRATPADAPNRFVVGIQPAQVEPVRRALAAGGVQAELAPMVRGRLVRIAGRAVHPDTYPDDERAQRLIEREFNLSWRDLPPPGNRLAGGRWFTSGDRGRGVASVEEGLARTLGIGIGDRLDFVIAGEAVAVDVVALRKLDWDSMRVNFYVLTPSRVLEGFPASYITSFFLPAGGDDLTHGLVREFPNLTVVDVAAIVRQLQSVMGQVAGAVQFVFLFTLVAGAVVLQAALHTAFDERRYELALLRALGARHRQLRQALLTELAVSGAVAGLIAAAGSIVLGQVLAWKAFQLEVPVQLWLLPGGAAVAALLSVIVGGLSMVRLLNAPPILALRAGV